MSLVDIPIPSLREGDLLIISELTRLEKALEVEPAAEIDTATDNEADLEAEIELEELDQGKSARAVHHPGKGIQPKVTQR